MKYLRTYEGIFDFLKKKKVDVKPNQPNSNYYYQFLPDIEDCFVDLSDNGFEVEVNAGFGSVGGTHEINVDISKQGDIMEFKMEEVMESIRFTNSYIGDLGLKISRIDLYIYGLYDGTHYTGEQYFDTIEDLESDINRGDEAMNNVENIIIRIVKK